MTTMELLIIPGMDGSRELKKMRRESCERLERAAKSRKLAAALMSKPSSKTKSSNS